MKESIRIIFLADTHLGFDYPVNPKVERRRRGYDFFDNFKRVLAHAEQVKADAVIHGGDFFFRSKVPKKIVHLAYDIVLEFAEKGIPFIIVPGNHERSVLPESLLLSHPNIFIFDEPKTFFFEINNTKIALAGFPNVRYNIHFDFVDYFQKTRIESIEADIKLLCIHQAVEGATVGPQNFTFRNSHDTIRMRDIPTTIHGVLSGHIHRRQLLVKKTDHSKIPVIFPGSIERTAFAEMGEEKGFYDMTFVPKNGKYQFKTLDFITLPTRPMMDVVIDESIQPENVAAKIQQDIENFDPNSIVRIKLPPENNEPLLKILTASFLRELLPSTMNVQLSGVNWYKNRDENETNF